MNQELDFYYIVTLPSYLIAPDGSFLGPSMMECGCKIVEVQQVKEKYAYCKVNACGVHEEKFRNEVPSGKAKIGKDFTFIKDVLVLIKEREDVDY